jgi:hypothetical protein
MTKIPVKQIVNLLFQYITVYLLLYKMAIICHK